MSYEQLRGEQMSMMIRDSVSVVLGAAIRAE
jgi:hypothetical protein